MDNQEKDFLDDIHDVKPTKKILSEQKIKHLENIRVKALEKKREMKEITEKANKLKEIESLKKAKQYEKEKLAKQYDEMIAKQKAEKEDKENIKPRIAEEDIKPPKENIKPKKKKIIKKVIYQEESSSDSDGADEVEIVKVKKQSKPKQQEPKPTPQPINNNNSYSNLLYESSVDKLKHRFMEERAKNLIMSVMPNYS